MEMYTGAEHRATETYMIPGAGSNPHPTFLPQLEEIGYMGNEMAPEFIVDQGVYYPAANYYGYYTGFETPSEWDDHNQFLGLDGQDVHYSGLQTESLPYAYYTSSYAQSPYNPYNPYIPGAVIGVDGPYAGTQQYFTAPPYQPSAYIPVVVQPGTDAVPQSNLDPSLFSTGAPMASAHVNSGVKYAPSLSSGFAGANSQRSASGTSQSFQNAAKSSQASLVNVPPSRQSSSQGAMSLGSAAHLTQVRNSSGLAQTAHQFSQGRVPSIQDPIKVTVPSNDGFTQFGSNGCGWATPDKFRPRSQFNGVVANPTGGTDVLGEQNKGPRTGRSKGQWTSAIVNGAHTSKVGASNVQRSITISVDQYNRDDFPVDYSNAKFFVIKSYSEDDVHKSIKYNVWSSTPNGNKKLGSAYEDAQRISAGKPRNCPIFLFFSVNASGQFCGVSEMVGPVDFEKDMDFWQQDKWTGSFPVKWHIIKDVPNMSFRHIILENNENKPVTNSRDTQEIWYLPGMNMLNIYKGSPLKTSILDDFMFYEERERIMQEEKSRILGRSYDSSHFLPAVVPVHKTGVTVVQTPKPGGEQSNGSIAVGKQPDGASDKPSVAAGKQPDGSINQPTKANGKRPNGTVDQPPKAAGNPQIGAVDQPSKSAGKPLNGTVDQLPKAARKPPNGAVDQPPKAAGKPFNGTVDQPPKAAGKPPNDTVDQPLKAAGKPPNGAVDQPPKAAGKLPNGAEDQPPKGDGKPLNGTVDRPPIAGGKPLDRTVDQPPRAVIVSSKPKDPKSIVDQPPGAGRSPSKLKDPKSMGDQHPRADKNPGKPKDLKSSTVKSSTCDEQVTHKFGSINSSDDKSNPKSDTTGETSGANSVSRIGSRSIDLKEGEASTLTDVVTVGSMRIKVKGFGESSSSSGVLTVGAIPFEPKGLKLGKQGTSAGGRPHEK